MSIVIHHRSKSRRDLKVAFCKLALADKDVRTALYTCDALIGLIMQWKGKVLPFEVAEAFISTIIVAYSRPFVQTSNSFPGKLPKKWHKFSTSEFQATHGEMLGHRHSLFAHTDPDVHKVTILPEGCLPKGIGPKPPQVAYSIDALQIPPHNVIRYRAVCADLQARLEAESQRILAELYGGMELPGRKFPLRYDDGL